MPEGESQVVIRPMEPPDLGAVVAIHLESFPGFFLSFLGPRFLSLLYESLSADAEGVVLVADLHGSTVGFVAGVTSQAGFYRRLLRRRKWAFALAGAGAVLRRPSIAPRLWRALRRPTEASQSAADACLMSIAVRPSTEGKGLGRRLVHAFCEEMRRRGVGAVSLTTDRDHNERVNRFYQQLGFRLARTFVTPEGRAMNEYVLALVKDTE
ncbi:MAG: GNAT family N-acetyltransferase [Armatimonadota bacterium]|nr:GNAT family N-acetyltransferase [Armatimonadota bacterium]